MRICCSGCSWFEPSFLIKRFCVLRDCIYHPFLVLEVANITVPVRCWGQKIISLQYLKGWKKSMDTTNGQLWCCCSYRIQQFHRAQLHYVLAHSNLCSTGNTLLLNRVWLLKQISQKKTTNRLEVGMAEKPAWPSQPPAERRDIPKHPSSEHAAYAPRSHAWQRRRTQSRRQLHPWWRGLSRAEPCGTAGLADAEGRDPPRAETRRGQPGSTVTPSTSHGAANEPKRSVLDGLPGLVLPPPALGAGGAGGLAGSPEAAGTARPAALHSERPGHPALRHAHGESQHPLLSLAKTI